MGDVIRFGFVLVLAAGATVAAPGPKEPPKKPPTIVGEWAVESIVQSGNPVNPRPGMRWTFTADGQSVLSVPGGRKDSQDKFTTDAGRTPAWLDLGKGVTGFPSRGIYKIDGDVLTICYVDDDADRPAKFESPATSSAVLVTLKRVKARD